MSVVLYRKHRPQSFKEVLGQDHIVGPLAEAVKKGALAHSYLFFGSRGTGKTSVARILAREIGCVPEDIYEIDAASNRGIDDVRELREGVRSLPFRSPYKVYIVDEVHMLTKEAFNALLKTLEEPPAHAIFILATTEVEKVPDTVLSRCETYTFKKPTAALLTGAVKDVAKKEGYAIEPEAAEVIAMLGDGSFRDALGVLQLVLSSGAEKKITREAVEKVTNVPSHVLVNEVIAGLAERDTAKALGAVHRAAESNADFTIFVRLLLKKLRFILLLRHAPDMKPMIKEELSEDDFALLSNLAGASGKHINSATILALLDAYTQTSRAHIPQLPLELALLKLIGENKNETTP
ncbi:MAG: DNA polymerase III subunit gamma/tau [Parcubacteria group bacterium]|nr:DNA polymerase III subunit gamma/tau [Parcubacteria group bacterium]